MDALNLAHWRVAVESNGVFLVAIESDGHLAGCALNEHDEQTIRACAQHLLSFVGDTTLAAREDVTDGVRACTPEEEKELDDALDMEVIRIRLLKPLVADLKAIATEQGIWHIPLIRHVLTRYADEHATRGQAAAPSAQGTGEGA